MKKIILSLTMFFILCSFGIVYAQGRGAIALSETGGTRYYATELEWPVGSTNNEGNRKWRIDFDVAGGWTYTDPNHVAMTDPNDILIIGDILRATTNTDRFFWIGDGTNYSPEACDLGTDTTGNYVTSITDADNGIDGGDGGSESAALTMAFDATELDALTWSDNANVSNIWTFNVSGTDHTMTAGNGTMDFSNDVDVVADLTAGTISSDGTISAGGAGNFGAWGYTGEHIALTDSSSNTNAGLGEYFEISSSITAGKVMAAEYSRLMCRTAQTNQCTLVGTESQFRLYGVNLADGDHAGLWAVAEQSGTSVLSGGGTFNAISATVESAAGFETGATEHVTGITIDSSINAGATINASTNFSGIYIKSNGKDWFDGLHITGATNDIKLKNGATINNTSADLLTITEVAVAVVGDVTVTGKTISTPSSDTSLLAATQITVTRKIMRVVGNGGAVTLTGTPIIVASDDGSEVIIQGTHDTNTVTLQDESSNVGSKLQLSGGNDFTLGAGDTIYLIYDSGDANWYEVTRSDN